MSTHHVAATRVDNPDIRALRTFALVAVPSGWLFLGVPVALGLPVEPFVLLTLLVGLVLPAVLLTRRDPDGSVRALLRDCFRPSRPLWLLVPALLIIPVLSWAVASLMGGAKDLDSGLAVGILVNIVSSLVIVNLWEEMAWMGFFQRRAMARWGSIRGSLVTAGLFVGIHLPLAFVDADGAGDIALNLSILVASSIGLRLLLAFVDRAGGGSILTVAIVHAAWNATGELLDHDYDWVRYAVTIILGLIAATTPMVRRDRTKVP